MASALDPKATPYRSNDPNNPIAIDPATEGTNGGGNGKRIRYSGDLELRLPFENSPLAKPSTSFRDPVAWYKEAKEGAETKINRPQEPAVISVPEAAHTAHASPAGDDSLIGGRLGRKGTTNSFFRNSMGIFSTGTRSRNDADAADGSLPRRAVGGPRGMGTSAPTASRRPAGPRAFALPGSDDTPLRVQVPDASSNGSLKRSSHAGLTLSIPMPAPYLQPRVWCYAALAILSAAAIALGFQHYRSPSATSDAAVKTASGFYLFVAVASMFLAVLCLAVFLFLGRFLYAYYDAPFLICQDIPLSPQSAPSSPNPSSASSHHHAPTSPGAAEAQPSSTLARLTGWPRTLLRPRDSDDTASSSGSIATPPRATLKHRLASRTPSPWVPLLDLGAHLALFLMWGATLADLGAKAKADPCNATSAPTQAVCPVPADWNRSLAMMGVGAAVGVGVVGVLAVKVYQVWSFGIVRSVIKRRF
ncbi:hypothetical protein HDU96_009020 [Phlyctochytrium bullatum]|nr:hypothetical protein HDU96_009020 [Phlyctochytrium bullatum]